MIEIQWSDTDPATGERCFYEAVRFARQWRFRSRTHRRGDWVDVEQPSRAMWEAVLDALRRRHQRRDKVAEEMVQAVERLLRDWREPPTVEREDRTPPAPGGRPGPP